MRFPTELIALLIVACGPHQSPVAHQLPDDWQRGAGRQHRILEVREGRDLLIETREGPLRVDWAVGVQGETEPLRDLDRMLAHVGDSELELDGLTLYRTALAGSYLYSRELVVLPEGVLVASDPKMLRERASERHERARAALKAAIERFSASLERRESDHSSRAALVEVLLQLDQKDDNSASFDVLPPSFARRLVRHGWLEQLEADETARVALEAAVLESEALVPLTQYASASSRLVYSEDAFGSGAWLLSTPERSGYSRLATRPAYYPDAPSVISVVHLPPGTDPAVGSDAWLGADLYRGDVRLAAWDREQGFQANVPAWKKAFEDAAAEQEFALTQGLPPHLLVTGLDGDVLSLITAHGRLEPARDGSAERAERFLAEAAVALPDAAHLDLIGEYLLVYVYDSPDTRRPWLVGTLQWSGDVHQTALETLATHTGGTYRGDCDDLSELYQEIAVRQGKNSHLIGLPAHAALAWSERDDEEIWHTYLLQTGPPLEFDGATLDASLDRLYTLFGSGEVLDHTRLEILLRFSGENTRSSWFLSSRIFSDPDYAQTMIDVQRDWHFQTYHRAIKKMKLLIESGDRDPANLAELGSLYRYTGQYDESADTLLRALELLVSEESRLTLSLDRLEVFYAADRDEEARALAREILDVRLPELEGLGQGPLLDPLLGLVDVLLVDANDIELGLEVLARRIAPRVGDAMRVLMDRIASEDFDPKYWRDGGDELLRHQLRRYAGSSIAVLRAAKGTPLFEGADWTRVSEAVGLWFERIAFHDVEGPETVLGRYSLLARYYEARHGIASLRERVAAAPLPESGVRAHMDRSSASLDDDLSWASISPSYWAGAQRDLFGPDRSSVDGKHVAALAERVARARDEARAVGLDHPSFEGSVRTTALVAAIFAEDPARLRTLLRGIKVTNDRQQLWETASWLAAVARFLSLEQYAEVLEIWRAELNYKPMYFWIAWNAALEGAAEHALLVAELAATEFDEDAAFVEEYEFMRSLHSAERHTGPTLSSTCSQLGLTGRGLASVHGAEASGRLGTICR